MEFFVICCVNVFQFLFFYVFYSYYFLCLIIDFGVEINMMRVFLVWYIGVKVIKSFQIVLQVDGCILLVVVGEICFFLICYGRLFILEVFVVEDFDVDILVGMFFMIFNDIVVCFVKCEIIIVGCDVVFYGCF